MCVEGGSGLHCHAVSDSQLTCQDDVMSGTLGLPLNPVMPSIHFVRLGYHH